MGRRWELFADGRLGSWAVELAGPITALSTATADWIAGIAAAVSAIAAVAGFIFGGVRRRVFLRSPRGSVGTIVILWAHYRRSRGLPPLLATGFAPPDVI